jgi:hypothetical protein
MKTLCIIAALALSITSLAANDGTFVTKVIHDTDTAFQLNLNSKHWIKITNFVQQGGTQFASVAVYQGAAGSPGVTLLLASDPTTTHTPHDDVFVTGPSIIYIAPIPGATVMLTYLTGSN